MPFRPMHSKKCRSLRTARQVDTLYRAVREPYDWVCQPRLTGDRACLAVVDKKVYVQNQRGEWYSKRVNNVPAFLKMPNRTCLDGVVQDGTFYPFEALSVGGKMFLHTTANEREVMAYHLMCLINQPWIFGAPSKNWLLKRRDNMPRFSGVVLKRSSSVYEFAGHSDWVTHAWA